MSDVTPTNTLVSFLKDEGVEYFANYVFSRTQEYIKRSYFTDKLDLDDKQKRSLYYKVLSKDEYLINMLKDFMVETSNRDIIYSRTFPASKTQEREFVSQIRPVLMNRLPS